MKKTITVKDYIILDVRKHTKRTIKSYCKKHGIKIWWFVNQAVKEYIANQNNSTNVTNTTAGQEVK